MKKIEKHKKNIRNNITGILLLDKPVGISSNKSLQRIKNIYNAKKAGHTGNLDVPASGLLPICFGEATKICGYLLNSNKKYYVKCKLGETTKTGDATGTVLLQRKIPTISKKILINTFKNFIGNIQQIPPMFSALKYNGKRLYKFAYKDIEVERTARNITIYNIEFIRSSHDYFEIEVSCSKGTYIRTLVEDIGEKIGCGAHVSSLRRLETGPFHLSHSSTLEEIESIANQGQKSLYDLLLPMDTALKDIPEIRLDKEEAYCLSRGQFVEISDIPESGPLRIYNSSYEFIGVGDITEDGQIRPKRLINIV